MAISEAVQDGFAAPSFSYHAIVSSITEAETISRSPSPSISATWTSYAPSALVAITVLVNVGSAAPLFSSQPIVSSFSEAPTISKSPSPSISATVISLTESAFVIMVAAVKDGLTLPSFSYHLIVSS